LFQLTVTNNGVPFQQDWEIPSRSSCLACHTPVAGFSLTFNTREMNKDNPMNGVNGNQIQTMSSGGYFSAAVPNPHTLPAFAVATDTNFSLEYRVRSYLAVNCVQCHQPGGAGQGNWNARPELTLAQTQMINGTPVANDGGNPANKIIVPGDTNHSVLLLRLENTNGFSRMPPLATHQLDLGSIALVQNWITGELPGHVSYSQWITNYPSLIGPAADPGADPDGDGANNYFEYLTGTSPLNGTDAWKPTIQVVGGTVQVSYPQVPNLGVVIDVSTDLATWTPWDVAGNQPVFASFSGTRTVNGPVSTVPPFQFFRARLIQP
jgi:mono/diheme cytochrome c family protein